MVWVIPGYKLSFTIFSFVVLLSKPSDVANRTSKLRVQTLWSLIILRAGWVASGSSAAALMKDSREISV
jgi:hypothetical protein